ncbi:MAG: glutamate--tRNA ligase [Aestuariivita sp.]|nr:glutamate--tRNA ligase [Aestuariivita sp.]
MPKSIVTRFAPSPTGFLHIGGARTALFNWLYARGRNGRFLLRIEDTDRIRSTPEATNAILNGLTWLGLNWDGEPVSQHSRIKRHVEVAYQLLANDKAYKCYSTPSEINVFRKKAQAEQKNTFFRSPWRDTDPKSHPDAPFVIRIKSPNIGTTEIKDIVQGNVTVRNEYLDDMILLRSDGTPVYMLAVVVDDHDMGITHIIRGDDHLNNAARQMMIYQAMEWDIPIWVHIPLIHGPDGKKLSKRHGAVSLEEYQKQGLLAAGMRNYLARLGWSHGNDEFFNDSQALEWFDIDRIRKSPARFDLKKMMNLSGQHITNSADDLLIKELEKFMKTTQLPQFTSAQRAYLSQALYCLKDRAKTLQNVIEHGQFALCSRPIDIAESAAKTLHKTNTWLLAQLTHHLQNVKWNRACLQDNLKSFAERHNIKLGDLVAPLRVALAGQTVSPSVFDMMLVLGQEETLARLKDVKKININ